MDFILENIQREKYFLINGRSYSGKTMLAAKLKDELSKDYNVSSMDQKTIRQYFNLSIFDNFNLVRLMVEGKFIEINLSSLKILPEPSSEKFKSVFKKNKYSSNTNSLFFEKNVLIIDNCDLLRIDFLKSMIKAIELIFDDVKIILLGNSRTTVNFHNIFSDSIFKKNIYELFNRFDLIRQTCFTKEFYFLITHEQLYLTDRREEIFPYLKIYAKARDVDIIEQGKRNKLHLSCDYSEVDKFNNKFIPKDHFIFEPIIHFKNIQKDVEETFNQYYFSFLKTRVLFVGAKIIYNEEFGRILKIEKDKITVVIDNKKIVVGYKEIINKETGLRFSYMPIELGYCIHYKNLSPCDEAVMIISQDIPLVFFETCFNKVKSLYYKNTGLLNCSKTFSVSYLQSIANGTKK